MTGIANAIQLANVNPVAGPKRLSSTLIEAKNTIILHCLCFFYVSFHFKLKLIVFSSVIVNAILPLARQDLVVSLL